MEHSEKVETVTELYAELLEYDPKLITKFVPTNAGEQKAAFLKGDVEIPNHHYDKLTSLDFPVQIDRISLVGERILTNPALPNKHVLPYEQFIDGYKAKVRFMELAYAYKATTDLEEKQRIKDEYMKLNIDLFGEPDRDTYYSLLFEKISRIRTKKLAASSAILRDELETMIPSHEMSDAEERFKPSNETIEWIQHVVTTLYADMLSHIPEEQETFSPLEIQKVFSLILEEEFGGAANGWRVDIEPAQSINVKTAEKRVVIPIDRGDISNEGLRELVVHEIGVHVLRSIMGETSDLEPLKNGLNNYYDAEEGLGKVMEQALNGKFIEAGIDHYITAGLAYFDGMDFRKTFECKWRLSVLDKLEDGEEPSPEAIEKAKNAAYKGTMRIFRGTDELPWFKDLAYYNGSRDMWRHLENIKGDDIKFMFVLLGKADPSDLSHQHIMLETKTT